MTDRPSIAAHIARCGVSKMRLELLQLYGDSEIRAAVDAGEIIGIEIMDAGLKVRVRRYVPRVWLPPRLLERLGL